jgi:ribosomal protein S18 acetylase RimI-like enzyme
LITIRRALTEDIPGIRSVLAVTWRDTYLSFLPESSIAKVIAKWHSPQVLEAEINQSSNFVGIAKSSSNEIVGMITANLQDELLSVTRLYVLPEFQRQGIGARLMDESYRAFPEIKRIQLDVEEQNQKARAFYRKLGFKEVGIRIDDVAGTKLNSIVLEKHIQGAA